MAWIRAVARSLQVEKHDDLLSDPLPGYELACFSAGCFWHVKDAFQTAFGDAVKVACCYTGDASHAHPVYENVGNHAESILIRFDAKCVSYAQLVEFFFKMHDATQRNGQGVDLGRAYRSVIWHRSELQKQTAKRCRDAADLFYQKQVNGQLVATRILPCRRVWIAETKHQTHDELRTSGL